MKETKIGLDRSEIRSQAMRSTIGSEQERRLPWGERGTPAPVKEEKLVREGKREFGSNKEGEVEGGWTAI